MAALLHGRVALLLSEPGNTRESSIFLLYYSKTCHACRLVAFLLMNSKITVVMTRRWLDYISNGHYRLARTGGVSSRFV